MNLHYGVVFLAEGAHKSHTTGSTNIVKRDPPPRPVVLEGRLSIPSSPDSMIHDN